MKDRYHFYSNNVIPILEIDSNFEYFYFHPSIFRRKI